jgi:uncharacterized protein YecE (DUF72 family)
MDIRIGTAGWAVPRLHKQRFPAEGAGLGRYAARLNCAEINSSFYRPHRRATYEGWAAGTPDDFRFAVKAPRELTHHRRLADPAEPLAGFLDEIAGLGGKLGPVLIQLPPKLGFEPDTASAFFAHWRACFDGPTVLEPRNPSWFEPEADALLADHQVARVAADPGCVPAAAHPGGWDGLRYWRLHGSPRKYSTSYDDGRLEPLAAAITASASPAWCVFDNPMHGVAAANALELAEQLNNGLGCGR